MEGVENHLRNTVSSHSLENKVETLKQVLGFLHCLAWLHSSLEQPHGLERRAQCSAQETQAEEQLRFSQFECLPTVLCHVYRILFFARLRNIQVAPLSSHKTAAGNYGV